MSAPNALLTPATDAGPPTSIDINGWTVTSSKDSISNASEINDLQAQLDIPPPEMTFGNNALTVVHRESGWTYTFNTRGALANVRAGELQPGDGGVKVGYADAWLKSRTDPTSTIPLPETVNAKPYDWTYTTTYQGHESDSPLHFSPADSEDPSHTIPIAELTRKDPIMFFAEIPLFEDELHDNGASQMTVRVRVMPSCLFILSRFTLRVDNVLFRTYDTRLYHSFRSNPPIVVRESKGWEAPYESVKRCLPNKEDLTPLTDPDFIAGTLTTLPVVLSQRKGAGTGWRGKGTCVEILKLGVSRN